MEVSIVTLSTYEVVTKTGKTFEVSKIEGGKYSYFGTGYYGRTTEFHFDTLEELLLSIQNNE